MPELYHWEPNTVFLKPLIAMYEKQVAFTSHYFDPTLLEPAQLPVFDSLETANSLEREGPVLVDDNAIICGSFFLLEFIAENYPGTTIIPADPYLRYRVQELGQVLGFSLGTMVNALGCAKYLAPQLQARDRQELDTAIAGMEPAERRNVWQAVIDLNEDSTELKLIRDDLAGPVTEIEAALQSSPWLAGDAYTIADIDIFSMLRVLPDLAPELVNEHTTAKIMDYLQRMHQRPAVKQALAMSRTGNPRQCFVPVLEPSRWLGL